MPRRMVSVDAPVARPSRARSAKTTAKDAIANPTSTKSAITKIAAAAKYSIKKLSAKPSTKAKSTAPKYNSANSKTTTKSTAHTSNLPNAIAKKKPFVRSDGAVPAKRTYISKKRVRQDDDDSDKENEPKTKKPRAMPGRKPKTAAVKLLETKANMTAKKSGTTKAARTKAAFANAIAAPVTKKTPKRRASGENECSPIPKRAKKDGEVDEDTDSDAAAPKERKMAVPRKIAAPKKAIDPIMETKIGVRINFAPTDILDIFVFGEGGAGELGLGVGKINGQAPIDVKRPRKNILLCAPDVGVVQLACGGMHCIALTKDNKILTWGVNDDGALGRDTKWDGGMEDVDAPERDHSDSDSDNDNDGSVYESGLNPRESTPTEIDTSGVAPGTKFVQVAASDSASFALTEDGRVYSWGTFRGGDGALGFSAIVSKQLKPILITDVTKIVSIATGCNHVLVLDNRGKVFAWGAPEQNQLGRRVVERDIRGSALRAGGVAFKRGTRITKIACGSYHSFALDDKGRVWSWGLNNHGQLGHSASINDDDLCQLKPKHIDTLADHRVTEVYGGEHHSMVVTDAGKALVFGRVDQNCLGIAPEQYTQENSLYNAVNKSVILAVPTELLGLPKIVSGGVGTTSTYVVSEGGRAYSWGFNDNYQCGIGETVGDVPTPQPIENSAIKDRKIVFASAGGQFGVLASVQVKEE